MRPPAVTDDAVAHGRALGVALSDDELRRIGEHLGRVPTATELFAFDAQWSEHCSYKSSREHLGKLPTDGPSVLLGVGEDAGIVRLGEWNGETYGIVVAHESHNHPSQVVPFEGAATGVGGIVRDVLCMGAEVIGIADPLRFGRLEDPHCRYVAQSVVDGIAAYGNAIGVPNVGGDVFFDESFDDNVLVNVIALGLVKEKEIIRSRAPQGSVGWDIVLVGKATDRSGFGGASFSSLTLDEDDAEQNKGAVQVPDPFLKNVIMRASYAVFAQMRAQGVVAGFKDLGAGGLAGCSAELCAAGGMGAEVELDRVATSQRDLPPEVIAIGETQERLCWIVPPSFTPTLLSIYNETYSLPRIARGACAAAIGKVTDTGRYVAKHRGTTVMDVDLAFLTGGIRYSRPYVLPQPPRSDGGEIDADGGRDADASGGRDADADGGRDADASSTAGSYAASHGGDAISHGGDTIAHRADAIAHAGGAPAQTVQRPPVSLLDRLRAVLAHRDVCSRASIYQRFDGVVRGVTAIPPGYADAGVLVPIPGAPLAVATGIGGNPRYGKLDPMRAAELAVVEAVASVTAVGATPVGLTDCLNFGDPTVPEQMGAFVAAVGGLSAAARALNVPFVSGNVSLYNRSSNGSHVAPSPIVGCIGVLDDVSHVMTPALKAAGSTLLVVTPPRPFETEPDQRPRSAAGGAPPDTNPNTDFARRIPSQNRRPRRLGGSVIAEVLGLRTVVPPEADLAWFARASAFVRDTIAGGLVTAVRDISDGGALAACAEMVFAAADRGTPVGVRIDTMGSAVDAVWAFDETPGFVLEVPSGGLDAIEASARAHGMFEIRPIARTIAKTVVEVCGTSGEVVETVTLTALREVWETPLRDFYGARV